MTTKNCPIPASRLPDADMQTTPAALARAAERARKSVAQTGAPHALGGTGFTADVLVALSVEE